MLDTTKGTNMTREQAHRAMTDGARVIGYAGEDTDTGYILELSRDALGRTMARVGWDSCQQSECDVDGLDLDPCDS